MIVRLPSASTLPTARSPGAPNDATAESSLQTAATAALEHVERLAREQQIAGEPAAESDDRRDLQSYAQPQQLQRWQQQLRQRHERLQQLSNELEIRSKTLQRQSEQLAAERRHLAELRRKEDSQTPARPASAPPPRRSPWRWTLAVVGLTATVVLVSAIAIYSFIAPTGYALAVLRVEPAAAGQRSSARMLQHWADQLDNKRLLQLAWQAVSETDGGRNIWADLDGFAADARRFSRFRCDAVTGGITIVASCRGPARARRIANALAEGMVRLADEQRRASPQLKQYESMTAQLQALRSQREGYRLMLQRLEGLSRQLAGRYALLKLAPAVRRRLDELTEQINLIIHHEDFRRLEGTWRGLHHLVSNTETDENLKIKIFNISKKELARTLRRYKGTAWDQSPVFKKIYEEEYGTPGGEPYGCLIGDYYFNHTPPDVELLSSMAQIAAAAHAPFIAGADPSLMNMESWQELGDPRDLTKIFQTAEYAAWRSLREAEDSKYVGLTLPRFLARLPYGAKTNPVEEFDFEEDVEGADHNKYVWANAAYAMGVNINRAFKLYGWCSRIRGVESGGLVEGLPTHTFPTDDGGVDMKCPTEVAITDRREKELADNGFIPLSHYKNTDYAVFFGAQSLHKPAEYEDPDATANAKLGARLPYLFAACRFQLDRVEGRCRVEPLHDWLDLPLLALARWDKQQVPHLTVRRDNRKRQVKVSYRNCLRGLDFAVSEPS